VPLLEKAMSFEKRHSIFFLLNVKYTVISGWKLALCIQPGDVHSGRILNFPVIGNRRAFRNLSLVADGPLTFIR
jgi:hypothetical protein